MFKKIKVKICGLTREADVDLALSLGADFCGFITYEASPRGISLDRAAELAQRVPIGKRVFVDVGVEVEKLREAKRLGFDSFQVHAGLGTSMAVLAGWSGVVGAEHLWLAPRIGPADTFPVIALEFCNTFLIDTYSKSKAGGTGETGDWERFAEFKSRYLTASFLLAGGLNAENVLEAIAVSGTEVVDVSSGVEISPGVKDATKLKELFERLNS